MAPTTTGAPLQVERQVQKEIKAAKQLKEQIKIAKNSKEALESILKNDHE